jgi:hypothetical protein
MKLELPQDRVGNALVFFSRLGYHSEQNGSFAKRVSGQPFPRYHVYVEQRGEIISVNLHLDAKRPSYAGTSAHAGEYDGSLIEQEIARIRSATGVL